MNFSEVPFCEHIYDAGAAACERYSFICVYVDEHQKSWLKKSEEQPKTAASTSLTSPAERVCLPQTSEDFDPKNQRIRRTKIKIGGASLLNPRY